MAHLIKVLSIWVTWCVVLAGANEDPLDGDDLRESLIQRIYFSRYPPPLAPDPAPGLAAVESQQVAHHSHHHYEPAASKKYGRDKDGHSGYYHKDSYKGAKGYDNKHGYKSSKKADHSKGNKSNYKNEKDKKYGSHGKKHDYKGHKKSGEKGSKGYHSGSKGHDNKGDKTEGFKNIWHSEEYGREKKFYDDFDHKTYHTKYDDFDAYQVGHDGSNYKGDHAKGDKEHHTESKKKYHDAGKYHKDEEGSKKDYGHKEHYGDKENYGKKGGYEESYKDGHGSPKSGKYDHASHSVNHPVSVPKEEETVLSSYDKSGTNSVYLLKQPDNESEEGKVSTTKSESSKKQTKPATNAKESSVEDQKTKTYNKIFKRKAVLGGDKGKYAGYITHPSWFSKTKPYESKKIMKPKPEPQTLIKSSLASLKDRTVKEPQEAYKHKKHRKFPTYFEIRRKPTKKPAGKKDKTISKYIQKRKNKKIEKPTAFIKRTFPTLSKTKFGLKTTKPNVKSGSKLSGAGPQESTKYEVVLPVQSSPEDSEDQDPSYSQRIPIPILKKEDSQQVSVISSVELKPSAAGKGDHGKSEGHKEGYHEASGEKGNKGGKETSGYKGNHYGDHAKERDSNYADKGHKKYKSEAYKKDYKGDHEQGKKGSKGHHYGSKGHHNKGHLDKGFKNEHHKFEYSVKKKFYKDNEDKSHYGKYDDFDAYFDKLMADNLKEHDHHGKEHKSHYGFDDFYKGGHFNDDHYGQKGSYGDEKKYKHNSGHGEKGHNSKTHGSSYGKY